MPEIKAPEETTVPAPRPQKTAARELEQVVVYMMEQITKRFRNGVLNSLQAKTVAKFADAQVGNFSAVTLELAKKVTRDITTRFDDKRIKAAIEKIVAKMDAADKAKLYAEIEKKIGISSKQLAITEGMKPTTNALILETTEWVKRLRDDTLSLYTANTLHAMAEGEGLEGILDQFDGLAEKRKNHAKFTARNQINNFNSLSTKIRAQNLGITEAIWVTSRDERVRDSHAARDGKRFDLAKGCYSATDGKHLLPGVDYQCRCTYRLIIPGTDI